MKLWYVVRPADLIPKGYGVAYRKYNQDVAVVVLIPFNILVRIIRDGYYALVQAGYPSKWEKILDSHWAYGVDVGKNSRQHEIEMLKLEIEVYKKILMEAINEG